MGKGRQAAKTEIERLKLGEIGCEQGVTEVAKMCDATPTPIIHPQAITMHRIGGPPAYAGWLHRACGGMARHKQGV